MERNTTAKKKKPKWRPERGEYRGIFVAVLDSPEFMALSAEATACFWPLKLRLGKAGIKSYPDIVGDLSHDTKLPEEDCAAALRELIDANWVKVEGNMVWLRNGLRFDPNQPLKNKNHRAGIEAFLKTLPKVPIVNEFADYYKLQKPFVELASKPMASPKASAKGFRKGSPEASRITDDRYTDDRRQITEMSDLPVPVSNQSNLPSSVPQPPREENGSGGGGDEADALVLIESLLNDFVRDLDVPEAQVSKIQIQLKAILGPNEATLWRDETGDVVPWSKRPEIVSLGLYRYAAEGYQLNQLRGHVKYVIKQQLGEKTETKKRGNGTGPKPHHTRAVPTAYEYKGATELPKEKS